MSEQLSIADVLERAADLIKPEGKWTTRAFARTAKGRLIGYNEAAATCFCALGAIARTAGGDNPAMHRAAEHLASEFPPSQYGLEDGAAYISAISTWNDAPERTQAEVVAKLREAAAKARTQQVPA